MNINQQLKLFDKYTIKGNVNGIKYFYELNPNTFKEYKKNIFDGRTYLNYAVEYGKPNVVEYLIDEIGFNVNAKLSDDSTILHCAVKKNNIDVIKLLIEKYKLDPNSVNNSNCTPLMYCLFSENNDATYKVSEYLIDKTNLNICDNYFNYNCLYVCGLYENYYVGKLIVETNKINYNHKDKDGLTINEFLEKNMKDDPSLLMYILINNK